MHAHPTLRHAKLGKIHPAVLGRLRPALTQSFIYLVAVMDWLTRLVLAGRVSITLEADSCVEAVKDALARYGTPEIFNTDSHTINASSQMV